MQLNDGGWLAATVFIFGSLLSRTVYFSPCATNGSQNGTIKLGSFDLDNEKVSFGGRHV